MVTRSSVPNARACQQRALRSTSACESNRLQRRSHRTRCVTSRSDGSMAAHRHNCNDLVLRTRAPMIIQIRVNDDLLLDAGAVEDRNSSETIIHPPRVTLFHQVLSYLHAKPDPPASPTGLTAEAEGLAAAAVALRWGSYVAVLADRAKPVWSEARSQDVSRICHSEMARINIEASAALAEWVDLCRDSPVAYEQLVRRAVAFLPMPKARPRTTGVEFAILAVSEFRELPEPTVRECSGEHSLAQRSRREHPRR
jgi:hypothetical protein